MIQFFHESFNLPWFREPAQLMFGEHEPAVHLHVEDAVLATDELRLDAESLVQ